MRWTNELELMAFSIYMVWMSRSTPVASFWWNFAWLKKLLLSVRNIRVSEKTYFTLNTYKQEERKITRFEFTKFRISCDTDRNDQVQNCIWTSRTQTIILNLFNIRFELSNFKLCTLTLCKDTKIQHGSPEDLLSNSLHIFRPVGSWKLQDHHQQFGGLWTDPGYTLVQAGSS